MPIQHIDGSAALDSGLPAACIAGHLTLRFPSPHNRNRLAILAPSLEIKYFSHAAALSVLVAN
jgi:hypothetical protein